MNGRALLILLAFLAAPLAAADLGTSRPSGVLRVLVSADEMPEVFSFKPEGLPGYERELVEGFTRTRKLDLQIVPVRNWDQIIPMLVRGEGDLIVGIVDTQARRKLIAFTKEIYPVRHLVVTRAPRTAVTSVADLRKLKVAVIPGTTWADAAAEAGVPAASQLSCTDLNDALDAVRKGRAEATVMAVFDFALARKHDPALVGGMFLGASGTAAWAVRKEDTTLLAGLDEYLEALRHSPVRSALAVKYFSEDALGLLRRARKEE